MSAKIHHVDDEPGSRPYGRSSRMAHSLDHWSDAFGGEVRSIARFYAPIS